ncbi:hypothetical protein KUV75_04475 [Qipengyuania gaetbuli]|uniref:hypothetical protein n=1 Tax=Qipengyuania gaetbuli TaxID=266952 RepID=UPI001C993C43|nr:hypothetical protein [Qipengyuania gaetbuli]MBY6014156.1 hypothetical protein [Qipengyuania gaetbuli]
MQFVTLPVFFASWSADRVGTWLLLFAIPAYVAIAATGFAAAGGNSALAAMQAGDRQQAAADFHGSWLVTTIATGVLAVLFFIGMAAVVPQMSGLDLVSASEGTATLAWLALYIFAVSQTMIAEIPFRAAGKYPEYFASYNAASLVEVAVIALSVVASDSFATLAMALALSRCAGALLFFRLGKNYAPELFQRSGKPLGESIKPLVKPSLAFMLAPLIFGINLQGFVLVLGLSVGAAALAGFVAPRPAGQRSAIAGCVAAAQQPGEAAIPYLPAHMTMEAFVQFCRIERPARPAGQEVLVGREVQDGDVVEVAKCPWSVLRSRGPVPRNDTLLAGIGKEAAAVTKALECCPDHHFVTRVDHFGPPLGIGRPKRFYMSPERGEAGGFARQEFPAPPFANELLAEQQAQAIGQFGSVAFRTIAGT